MPVTRFYFLLFLLIGIYPAFLHAQEVKSIEEHTPDSSMSQKGKAFIKDVLQDSLKKHKHPLNDSTIKQVLFDSLKQNQATERLLNLPSRSLNDSTLKKAAFDTLQHKFLPDEYNTLKNLNLKSDSAGIDSIGKNAANQGKQLAKDKALQEVSPEGQQVIGQLEQLNSRKDSLNLADELSKQAEQQAGKITELQDLQKQTGENPLEGMKSNDVAEKSKAEYEGLTDVEKRQQEAKQRMRSLALDVFSENSEKLQAAVEQLQKHKKKYGWVQNAKGEGSSKIPFKKRLFTGGNFQFVGRGPFQLDIAPLIGYRINQNWIAGAGANYRCAFTKENDYLPSSSETWGYRSFLEYQFPSTWFFHAEYESISKKSPDLKSDGQIRKWHNGMLAGGGKEFTIAGKLRGQVMLLYNFLHENGGPYAEPWMIRMGVKWGK